MGGNAGFKRREFALFLMHAAASGGEGAACGGYRRLHPPLRR